MKLIKSSNIFLVLLLIASISITSCKKKVQGCTDSDADNYNGLAEEDDGTCYYSGGAVFYHRFATSEYMLDNGITYTKIYLDDVYYGQLSANTHWTFIPTCSSTEAVSIENYGLANQKTKQFNYKIKDNNNVVLKSGTFILKANNCEAFEVIL